MKVKPIPNSLLGENIMLVLPTATGFSETPIKNVRVELSDSLDSYGKTTVSSAAEITVWADRRRSTWADFPVGARVDFRGVRYTITQKKICYADGEPHHCKFTAKRTGDDGL